LKLGVSVLLNAGIEGPAELVADMVMQAALDVLDSSLGEYQPPPPLPPNPARYVGNYTAVIVSPPDWLDSVTANITMVTDVNGHPRILLQYGAYMLSSAAVTPIGINYLNYDAQLQQFQLVQISNSCSNSMTGGNQYVVFAEQASPLSFRIAGLFWGVTWYKDE